MFDQQSETVGCLTGQFDSVSKSPVKFGLTEFSLNHSESAEF
jgi:hypothetical protein